MHIYITTHEHRHIYRFDTIYYIGEYVKINIYGIHIVELNWIMHYAGNKVRKKYKFTIINQAPLTLFYI